MCIAVSQKTNGRLVPIGISPCMERCTNNMLGGTMPTAADENSLETGMGRRFCMTPVDAYDVMLLMGLSSEAAAAKTVDSRQLVVRIRISKSRALKLRFAYWEVFSAPMS